MGRYLGGDAGGGKSKNSVVFQRAVPAFLQRQQSAQAALSTRPEDTENPNELDGGTDLENDESKLIENLEAQEFNVVVQGEDNEGRLLDYVGYGLEKEDDAPSIKSKRRFSEEQDAKKRQRIAVLGSGPRQSHKPAPSPVPHPTNLKVSSKLGLKNANVLSFTAQEEDADEQG